MSDYITIYMTRAAPLRIDAAAWPVIAEGHYYAHDVKVRSQAFREWDALLRVRQHADGRLLVAGRFQYLTAWQTERDYDGGAGELVAPGSDCVEAMERVAATLCEEAAAAGHEEFRQHIRAATLDCIEALPARELS